MIELTSIYANTKVAISPSAISAVSEGDEKTVVYFAGGFLYVRESVAEIAEKLRPYASDTSSVLEERRRCAGIVQCLISAENGLLQRMPDSPHSKERKNRIAAYEGIAWSILNPTAEQVPTE